MMQPPRLRREVSIHADDWVDACSVSLDDVLALWATVPRAQLRELDRITPPDAPLDIFVTEQDDGSQRIQLWLGCDRLAEIHRNCRSEGGHDGSTLP